MKTPVAPAVAGVVLAAWAALAVLASRTRPFTLPADAVVAVGFACILGAGLAQRRLDPVPSVLARRRDRTPASPAGWGRRWALWVLPVVAAVAWELYNYVETPRAAHPTLSSLLDAVDGSHAGRGLAFAAWLAFGWYLVTR